MPGSGASGSDWYHPDCWEVVRASEQRDYEENVRSGGLGPAVAVLPPPFGARP